MAQKKQVRKLKKATYGFAVIINDSITNHHVDAIIDIKYKYKTLRKIVISVKEKTMSIKERASLDELLNPPTHGPRVSFLANAYPVTLDQKMQDNFYVEETYGEFSMDTLNITCVAKYDN